MGSLDDSAEQQVDAEGGNEAPGPKSPARTLSGAESMAALEAEVLRYASFPVRGAHAYALNLRSQHISHNVTPIL